MICNAEILLKISAENLDDAERLAERIVYSIKQNWQSFQVEPGGGVLADASVEAVAQARKQFSGVAGPYDLEGNSV